MLQQIVRGTMKRNSYMPKKPVADTEDKLIIVFFVSQKHYVFAYPTEFPFGCDKFYLHFKMYLCRYMYKKKWKINLFLTPGWVPSSMITLPGYAWASCFTRWRACCTGSEVLWLQHFPSWTVYQFGMVCLLSSLVHMVLSCSQLYFDNLNENAMDEAFQIYSGWPIVHIFLFYVMITN